jgi:hypothetical protein
MDSINQVTQGVTTQDVTTQDVTTQGVTTQGVTTRDFPELFFEVRAALTQMNDHFISQQGIVDEMTEDKRDTISKLADANRTINELKIRNNELAAKNNELDEFGKARCSAIIRLHDQLKQKELDLITRHNETYKNYENICRHSSAQKTQHHDYKLDRKFKEKCKLDKMEKFHNDEVVEQERLICKYKSLMQMYEQKISMYETDMNEMSRTINNQNNQIIALQCQLQESHAPDEKNALMPEDTAECFIIDLTIENLANSALVFNKNRSMTLDEFTVAAHRITCGQNLTKTSDKLSLSHAYVQHIIKLGPEYQIYIRNKRVYGIYVDHTII